MRPTFELAFEVTPLTEDLEDAIDNHFDAVISTHGRTTKINLFVEGVDAVDAAGSAISTLRKLGIQVIRLMDDLVTRKEIAERACVTTQAVGLWARGERKKIEFPEPYIRAGSATLWLWGEVAGYLRRVGAAIDGGIQFPTRADIQSIGGMLAPERNYESGYTTFSAQRVTTVVDNVGATRVTRTSEQEYRAMVAL